MRTSHALLPHYSSILVIYEALVGRRVPSLWDALPCSQLLGRCSGKWQSLLFCCDRCCIQESIQESGWPSFLEHPLPTTSCLEDISSQTLSKKRNAREKKRRWWHLVLQSQTMQQLMQLNGKTMDREHILKPESPSEHDQQLWSLWDSRSKAPEKHFLQALHLC